MGKKSKKVNTNCLHCDKEFEYTEYKLSKGKDKYCSKECYDESQKKRIKKNCSACNLPIEVKPARNREHNFCSQECSHTFFIAKRRSETPTKECETCGEEYKVAKGLLETSRFCSKQCLQDWQKVNFKGENSPLYKEKVKLNCFWCNTEIERNEYRLKNNEAHFCGVDCRILYHKNVTMKTPEAVERNRQTALNNLKNGVFKTDSSPQLIVNEILNKLNIEFTNEYEDGYFSFDNHLTEHDLYIEVMGTYWHCDNRFYDEISYKIQLDRIISDKRKSTYVKNKHKKNILYLWEFDIENDQELCEHLILSFIDNKGKLRNYHSFNYLFTDSKLLLSKTINKPYMQYSAEQLEELFNPEVKDKLSKKQQDKRINFDCDHCGEESEQLLVQYIKSKNHFCSKECKNKFFKVGIRHPYNCNFCNEEILVKEHIHNDFLNGKRETIFCNTDCKAKWQKENKKGKNNPLYNSVEKKCVHCDKPFAVPEGREKTAKFCSPECRQLHSRKRVKFNCDNCGEEKEITPSQYAKSENHFCSHECADTYNSKKRKTGVEKNCIICGEKMYVIPSREETAITCSRECQGKWQSTALIGENANNYQGKGNSKHI